ncbi:MAG: hypothetical protein ACRDPW_05635 [Mycobacteriales bacterium]
MTTVYELPGGGELSVASLSSAMEAAEHGEVGYVTRDHHRVAAIVPEQVAAAGSAAIEALEDAKDLELMREGRESGPSIPLEQFRQELGL